MSAQLHKRPNLKEVEQRLSEAAKELEVVGAAVGIYLDGEDQYAACGVTHIEHSLPVDEHTLFQIGSTGKTLTGTAIVRLVEQGLIDLHERVRAYVPELRLKDEHAAAEVTLLQLLNHTAGWDGDFFEDTGQGDDAVARYVEKMAGLEQVTPLGKIPSYNNAAVVLAGRAIEKVTGKTYEQAVRELLFEPLGLKHSFFFPNEIMTHKFAAGHLQHEDGSITVARPWGETRGMNPAGSNIAMSIRDLIAWGRFHLGDGKGPDGSHVLSRESLDLMREPTFDLRSASFDEDYVGISWFIQEVGDVRLVAHGGSSPGQHCEFVTVPERDFVVGVLTNSSSGALLTRQLAYWALDAYLGVAPQEPEPVKLAEPELQEYAGRYETIAAVAHVSVQDGGLLLKLESQPEIVEQFGDLGEEMEPPPPLPLGFLPPPSSRFLVTDGPLKGLKGAFLRQGSGAIVGLHFGGRYAARV